MSAFDTQVGGQHYKGMAIQPTLYCHKNNLGTCESNIVKYASRHKSKGGRQDLEKVIQYAQLLIEMDYPDESARHEEPELTYAEHQSATDPAIKYARDMAELREDKAGAERQALIVQTEQQLEASEEVGDIAGAISMKGMLAKLTSNDPPKQSIREKAAARHLAEMSPSAQKGIEGCEACE